MFSHSCRRSILTRSVAARRWMGSDMPVPQSQNAPLWHGHKVAHEGWEESMYFYYAVGFLLQAAIVFGAPETSIESWARAEAQARLRLAADGQTEFEFGTHYQDLEKQASLEVWNKFANRSVIPGDDDDDEDDDEEEVSLDISYGVGLCIVEIVSYPCFFFGCWFNGIRRTMMMMMNKLVIQFSIELLLTHDIAYIALSFIDL